MHPKHRDFTYFSPPHAIYSRIDLFFVFRNDRHRVKSCDIGTRNMSDHSPIYLTINLETRPKKTVWRLNTGLLNNKAIIKEIKAEIKYFLEINDNGQVNPNILWDTLKAVVRGKFISLSAALKKAKENQLNGLENTLKDLENRHKKTQSDQTLKQIQKIKKQILDIYQEEEEKKIQIFETIIL